MIHDVRDDPRPRHARVRRHGPRRVPHQLLPMSLLLLLVLVAAWRVADGARERAATQARQGPDMRLESRGLGPARLDVPSGWMVLERGPEHVTWGTARRSHTVTLASTEASVLPLPGVVGVVVRESARELPAAKLLGSPRALALADAPRGDAAMLARFLVREQGRGALHVAQVWRRDARAGLDLVATWTSADGSWPVEPAAGVPEAAASG